MRMPAFERKKPSGVSVVIGLGKGAPDKEAPPNDGPSPAESMEGAGPAVCPKCGTCFDDESGEIYPKGHEMHPASDDDDEGPDPTAIKSEDEG